MSVVQDKYQLDIEILTEDSKKVGQLNTEFREMQKELRAAEKAGKDTSGILSRMAKNGVEASKIDLSKITKQQAITRARQLEQALKRIPETAPGFKDLEAEHKRLNDRLATLRTRTRGVAESNEVATSSVQKLKMGMSSLAKAGLVAIIAAIGAILVRLKDFAFGLADLSEEIEVMDRKAARVFGDMEDYVREFAETNAESLGLSKRQYVDLAASVSDLLVPLGVQRDVAAQLAVETTNAAGKLAEWAGSKIDAADATERVRKALLGERESLEALGIKISEELVQRKLQEKGLKELTGASLDQAKAIATLELIQERSADAMAQFGENQDTAARATARNKAIIQEQREEMAQRALPIIQQGKLLFFQFANAILSVVGGFFDYLQRLKQAAAASKNFQKIVGVAIGLVIGQFKSLLEILGGLGNAMISILNGEWQQALADVGDGFYKAGVARAEALKTGFEEGVAGFIPELPDPQKFQETGTDFEALYKGLATNGTRKAEDSDKVAESKYKADLANLTAYFEEKRLLAEANRFAEITTEQEHAEQLRVLKLEENEKRLALLAQHNKSTSLENQRAATEAAEIEAARREEAAESQAKQEAEDLKMLNLHFDERDIALREAYLRSELTKDELAAARRMLEEERLLQELQQLKDTGQLKIEEELRIQGRIAEIRQQAADAAAAINKKIADNEKKTAEDRIKIAQSTAAAIGQSIGAVGDLISALTDEEEKNKEALKPIKTAEVIINGIVEISKIQSTYAAAPPLAAALSIAAGIRTAANVAAINKAERGAALFGNTQKAMKQGVFGGRTHAGGGNRGVFEDGTQIEVERDELFFVINRKSSALIQRLGMLNSLNNWGDNFASPNDTGYFNLGGVSTINTTPSTSFAPESSTTTAIEFDELSMRLDRLASAIEKQRSTPTRAVVVLDEFEARQSERDYVAGRAAL